MLSRRHLSGEAALIDSLKSRHEQREVCGVAYGADGLRAVASLIHNWLVPTCRLKFVYFDRFPQDAEAAEQLSSTRLHAEGHLEIAPCTPETLESEMACPETVYFSWYTFEMLLETNEQNLSFFRSQLLRERRVVTSTDMNCRLGLSFATAGAEDQDIGSVGAQLIHERETGKTPHFGHREIEIPRLHYWINQRVSWEKGIRFAKEVVDKARKVYEPRPPNDPYKT